MKDVLGLLDCHTSPELGELTENRAIASTAFLGRYAFCDFPLSNFCNSEIDNVGILVKNHTRSIMKHMGSMMSWVNNTKIGHETILYNENGPLNPAYNTDINNLLENDWIFYKHNVPYIVIQSAHIITNIDLRPVVEEHKERKEDVTIVIKKITNADKHWLGAPVIEFNEEGYVVDIHPNDGKQKEVYVAIDTSVINRCVLMDILRRHKEYDTSFGLKDAIFWAMKKGLIKVHIYIYEGFARSFDSLEHYVEYSFEQLDEEVAKQLFKNDWPIYTVTQDTPPALYASGTYIQNSFIANGCIIEGEVKDSIICRNVKIGKGTKINRSIVFSSCSIGDGAKLSDVVIDKYSIVTKNHTIEGDPDNIIYLEQGVVI